jgi:hypothetical protein
MANKFHHIDISEKYAAIFAKKYVEQLIDSKINLSALASNATFKNMGFDSQQIETIIKQGSIPRDEKREQGSTFAPKDDIYRSDLGELLLTLYFEESKDIGVNKFIIPYKNITYREIPDMPGRGIDVIGYRIENNNIIQLLLGEAKVSEDTANPPQVVHQSADSIYKTHKKHKENKKELVEKLANHSRKLIDDDSQMILLLIMYIHNELKDNFNILFGCGLVRDYTCFKAEKDYGKMKTNAKEFEPYSIDFPIFVFTDKTITEFTTIFYQEVQKLKQQNE